MPVRNSYLVIKCDPQGKETWRYSGEVIERGETHVVLEAYFDRADIHFHGITLRKGDRFVETYYSNRWFNYFEIYDHEDGRFKGWYCNVSHPAIIEADRLSYRDLALDLLVYPDGKQLVLDEDEFATLPITDEVRAQALAGLKALQTLFKSKFA